MYKIACIVAFIFGVQTVWALRVHPLFTDNMVLQRGVEITVWGWAETGREIRVSILHTTKTTTVKQDGTWEVILPPFQQAGDKLQLTVSTSTDSIIFKNIAIGDVWLCAGQSNMAFQLYRSEKGKSLMHNQPKYDIRHIKIETNYSSTPLDTIASSGWYLNTSEELPNFTALGYYFAERVANKTNVPIGLINNAVGGSAIEAWMAEESFSPDWLKQYRDSIHFLEERYYQETISNISYSPTTIHPQAIFQEGFTFQNWTKMELPGRWEDKGYSFLDGIIYYAKDIELSEVPQKDSVFLSLATIDDADSVWVNGHLVGATLQWDALRQYTFPSEILSIGLNRILIKVMDNAGSGGLRGKKEDMYLAFSDQKIPLSGKWRFYINTLQLDSPWKQRHQPALCYNAMFYPITKFPVKGILWYQGEANAATHKSAMEYGDKLIKLINNWRESYGQTTLPFLYVQLPGYDDPRAEHTETWAILRQAQLAALRLPNTAIASIIDLGEMTDIHPVRKNEVGERLANLALDLCYLQKDNHAYNPQVDSFQIAQDGSILLYFKNVGDGLIIKQNDGSPFQNGFEIIDKNNDKYFASARLMASNCIKIECEQIEAITEIKYLWNNWNDHLSIFNKSGLPAIPFKIKL